MTTERSISQLLSSRCRSTASPGETIRRRTRRKLAPLRGAAALELALVLPLTLSFALASADFGRVVHAYLVLSNAARCGATYGSTHGFTSYSQAAWTAQIQDVVENEMQGWAGFAPANLQLNISTTTDTDGLFQVTVEVTYPFDTIVNWPGIPSHMALDRVIRMRQIR